MDLMTAKCRLCHPDSKKAVCFVPAKPFNGVICMECRAIVVVWSKPKMALWKLLWSWRFRGSVTVDFRIPVPQVDA